ncbi:MAG TPA: hypothetical protein VNL91_08285 [Thermoanaerobaculia bacterium]|nr:hypothetical protein [Thermoanaerobaculia bacterium]
MECLDALVLQRLNDGDLDDVQAELVAHHIESCPTCRAEAKRVGELRTLVEGLLAAEDEGEEDRAAAVLARIAGRLPGEPRRRVPPRLYRRTWLRVAALLVVAFLLPLPFLSELRAWPTKILEEAADRQRMWMYQPNKVLHWEVSTESHGVRGIADGHWRTVFWRNNGEKTSLEITRQYGPAGRLEQAYWQQPDGSAIHYRANDGIIEITPTDAAAYQVLPNLGPDLRAALHWYLERRAFGRSLEHKRRSDAGWLHGRAIWFAEGKATFRRGLADVWGEVHHITVVRERPSPGIEKVVHQYEIENSSYRLLRLETTISYTDGTIGTHDSRWLAFRTASDAEYRAQSASELLETGIPVVRLSPVDIASRQLLETKPRGHEPTRK